MDYNKMTEKVQKLINDSINSVKDRNNIITCLDLVKNMLNDKNSTFVYCLKKEKINIKNLINYLDIQLSKINPFPFIKKSR